MVCVSERHSTVEAACWFRYRPPKKRPGLEALRHVSGVCSCQKLRSASRAATKMYDEHLRPAGVRIGQYSMPLLKLAARLELDRTTLTRSVARLDRDGLISIELGSSDNRVRAISITEAEFAGHQTQPMLPGMKQRAFG